MEDKIKFYLSKERLLKIGEYINRQLIIHRNVEHDSNWTTEEKMIVQLYDFVVTLLDDITNLQEENKKLNEWIDNRNDYVEFLLAQNDRLHNIIISDDLSRRIDKAIELLKEAGCYDEETKAFCDDIWEELPKLLNILKGDDE